MEKILLVEDEARIRNIVLDYFTAHRLSCDLARNGEEALDILRDNVPIMFLTALGSEEDTLKGYALGCDDYVVKPFSLAILLAKTQALIRRRNGGNPAGFITCGAITLDTNRRLCLVGQEEVKISPREYDLLLCLMRNQDRVLSREQLLDKVWGLDFEGEDRAVDVRVRSLRAALGSAGSQIKTMYKAGYKLEEV